jgi:hypothetical protein
MRGSQDLCGGKPLDEQDLNGRSCLHAPPDRVGVPKAEEDNHRGRRQPERGRIGTQSAHDHDIDVERNPSGYYSECNKRLKGAA